MDNLTIFDVMYEKYKITKQIRLIELFAGYGSQNLALKHLGIKDAHYKICEWATKSIQAYNDLHIQDYNDYSDFLTFNEVVDLLYNKGISMNYNNPMTLEQIKRKGEKWCRKTYSNIVATNNLVNIQQVHANDLEIVEKEKYTYMMTYSFPCQDLSLAGKGKGMEKGSGTRSGMLWEVERILKECTNLPDILIMENVPQVHGAKNKEHFQDWCKELEELGYSNYWQDLNAKDYGMPQNRNRCFMVSLLGEYNYAFPKKQELKIRLKDMLETNPNSKYLLSTKMIDCFLNPSKSGKIFGRDKQFKEGINRKIARTITTLSGSRATDNFVVEKFGNKALDETIEQSKNEAKCDEMIEKGIDVIGNYSKSKFNQTPIVNKNGIAPIVTENHGQVTAIAIKKNTKKGYLLAEEGDGIDISSRMKTHRGTVQKNISQTILTQPNVGVVVKTEPSLIAGIGEKKSNGGTQYYLQDRIYDADSIAAAITTCCNPNYLVEEPTACEIRSDEGIRTFKDNCMGALRTVDTCGDKYIIEPNLIIRKLTPRECFRLMGLYDDEIDRISKQSDSSLYHLAGDSIVTNVLEAIFKEMIN